MQQTCWSLLYLYNCCFALLLSIDWNWLLVMKKLIGIESEIINLGRNLLYCYFYACFEFVYFFVSSFLCNIWFALFHSSRLCEICGETATNITGVSDNRFMEEWNERRSLDASTNFSDGSRRCMTGQPLCNFLMACLVIAFILPWFFRVDMFQWNMHDSRMSIIYRLHCPGISAIVPLLPFLNSKIFQSRIWEFLLLEISRF